MTGQDWIYMLNDQDELERIPNEPYADEALLQQLIADHPKLLSGDLIDPDNPPRWLLIRSEAGIPDKSDGGDRWAVDHLLLDQWGRPTFVEVKRSTDTRIRREVVGQMLDYAANASAYWPADRIRGLAVETAGGAEALEKRLTRFLSAGATPVSDDDAIETFWSTVQQHLINGEVRLLFVADRIPTELRRVIEFLNDHMPAIEVLGIEIRQYLGQNLKALVPRVVGQTEYARQSKTGKKPRSKLTREKFLALCSDEARPLFETVLAEAAAHDMNVFWGSTGFSLRVRRSSGDLASLVYGVTPEYYDDGMTHLEVYFAQLIPADEPQTLRQKLLETAPFQERGQYTLDLALEPEHIDNAGHALPLLWEAATRMNRNPAGP